MGLVRTFITLATSCVVGLLSCTTFTGTDAVAPADGGSDAGGGACPIPLCVPSEPSCHYDDFAAPTCPAEWTKDGTPPDAETFECTGGKLHIAADFTFDLFATLSVKAPSSASRVHLTARIAVKDWSPSGAALKLNVGGGLVWFGAGVNPKGRPVLYPCTDISGCQKIPADAFDTGIAEEHVYTFDIDASAVTISVDCARRWTLPGVKPNFSQSAFSLTAGMTDAEPLDATIDDVRVSFD